MTNTLNLAWQISEVIPTLPTGEDAKMLYDSLPEQVRVGLRYDEGSQTIIGSTPFASVNLDIEAQKYGARTPNLRDLSRPEVMRIAKDKYYIDSRNLVARSEEDSFSKNNSLLKTICGLVEAKDGTVKFPFMIEVFNFVPNPEDKTGYGLSIVAGPDFNVIQDERFEGKYSGKRFTEVDESGIPLFDKNGTRRWSAKDNGLSNLYLDGT